MSARRRVLVAYAVAHVTIATWLMFDVDQTDFRSFYESASAMAGAPVAEPLDRPNYNPPTFTWVIVPLTALSLQAAFSVWTLLGVVLVAWTLWRLRDSVSQPMAAAIWIGSTPAFLGWHEGQIVWLLLPVVTEAWLAHRRGATSAGWWLALAIAIKPPLALLAVVLPWPIVWRAGAGAAALSVAVIAIGGWAPWAAWLALTNEGGRYLVLPENLSLWGWQARLGTPWWLTAAALGVLAWQARRSSARWLAAWVWVILAQPLGWSYYLCLIVPAALAAPVRRRWAALLLAALLLAPLWTIAWTLWPRTETVIAFTLIYAPIPWLAWVAWGADGCRLSMRAPAALDEDCPVPRPLPWTCSHADPDNSGMCIYCGLTVEDQVAFPWTCPNGHETWQYFSSDDPFVRYHCRACGTEAPLSADAEGFVMAETGRAR